MAIGGSNVVAVGTANKVGLLVFDAAAGQRVAVTLSNVTISSSVVKLYDTAGTMLASSTVTTAGAFIDAVTLGAAGTYTILVDPNGSATGNMTVAVTNIVDVTGALATNGTPVTVPITTAGQNGRLTFTGTAGQRISTTLTASFGLANRWPLSIVAPDGTVLGSVSEPGIGIQVEILEPITLPVSGTYTVVVNPTGVTTGTVSVSAYDVVDVTGPIVTDGTPVTVPITTPGQRGRFAFTGTAGQRISVKLTAAFGLGSKWPLALLKPDGSILAQAPAVGVGITTEFIDPATLPVTGTYTVLVDPTSVNTGTVTVAAYDLVDVTGPIVTDGTPVSVPITTPGQTGRFTFTGTTGQRISVKLTAAFGLGGKWPLALLKPDGSTLAQVNELGNGITGEFIDPATLPVTGTYTVLVDPTSVNTGTVTISAYDVVDLTGSITVGAPAISVAITTPGQNALYTFAGTAGQVINNVTLTATFGLGGNWTLALLKPDGSTLASSTPLGGGTTTAVIGTQTLPVAGTYTVFINPKTSSTGTVTVSAQ
ncbi:MAG TPA: hypothetical protein VFV95_02965 [Vicinamibacterales bacterium]|nr:hypothetical protein [Vicinamibacterales bacterium]